MGGRSDKLHSPAKHAPGSPPRGRKSKQRSVAPPPRRQLAYTAAAPPPPDAAPAGGPETRRQVERIEALLSAPGRAPGAERPRRPDPPPPREQRRLQARAAPAVAALPPAAPDPPPPPARSFPPIDPYNLPFPIDGPPDLGDAGFPGAPPEVVMATFTRAEL